MLTIQGKGFRNIGLYFCGIFHKYVDKTSRERNYLSWTLDDIKIDVYMNIYSRNWIIHLLRCQL